MFIIMYLLCMYIIELKHVNFFSVVDVGFVQSVYTSSEPEMSASVCIEVKQGTLGIPVNFSLTTHDESAQGMYMYIHVYIIPLACDYSGHGMYIQYVFYKWNK